MTIRLTETAISKAQRDARTTGARVELIDATMPGLRLRVMPSGAATWVLGARDPAGRFRRYRLGSFPVMSISAARLAGRTTREEVRKGADPIEQRRIARLKAQQALTVGKLVESWSKARADQGRRASYLKMAESAMRKHLAGWLKRDAASVAKDEAVLRLDEVKESAGPSAANRLLSYARAAYGWAVKRQLLSANPFDHLEAPGATQARDRVLDMAEVAAIWRSAAILPAVYRDLVRVLLLTCARRDEVASMRWTELSPDLMTWTLPAERSKNGRTHVAHLAEATRKILAVRPRMPECPYVFPGKGESRPVSAFNYAKRKLDEQIAKARSEAELEPINLRRWTLHDFRRTAVTQLAEMGFAPHVCDRLLNHVTGSIQGVAAVYQRAEFAEERKAALIAWADAVMAAVEGRSSQANVVPLRGQPVAA